MKVADCNTLGVNLWNAGRLTLDYKDPASPVAGSELVCTSITSTGNGTTTDSVVAWNPT